MIPVGAPHRGVAWPAPAMPFGALESNRRSRLAWLRRPVRPFWYH
jgi:hypothetical protein